MEANPENFDPQQAATLNKLRLVAGAGLALVAAAPVTAMLVMGREAVKAGLEKEPTANQSAANKAAIALFACAVVVGWTMRMQAYKAHWQADAVTPAGYAKGITRFVLALVLGHWGATAIGVWVGYPPASLMLAPFALGLLLFGFPNGRPMLPTKPQLGERK